jgi:hypothetical protein
VRRPSVRSIESLRLSICAAKLMENSVDSPAFPEHSDCEKKSAKPPVFNNCGTISYTLMFFEKNNPFFG